MKLKERLSPTRIAVFSFSALITLAIFIFGIVTFFGGRLINGSFAVMHFIIPLLFACASFFIIFSSIRKSFKAILYMLTFSVLTVSLLALVIFGESESLRHYSVDEDFLHYSNIAEDSVMPTISEVGSPKSTEYVRYSFCQVFSNDVDYLIYQYNEENYSKQKAEIEEKYEFETSSLYSHGYYCEPAFEIDGYSFRMLADRENEYGLYFPQHIAFIITNDTTNEIIYMRAYDSELDYIDGGIEAYVYDDCGFRHIK